MMLKKLLYFVLKKKQSLSLSLLYKKQLITIVDFEISTHLSLLLLPDTEFNLNKDIFSHNNVPLEKPKCTPRGTYTPVWEPLIYCVSYNFFSIILIYLLFFAK